MSQVSDGPHYQIRPLAIFHLMTSSGSINGCDPTMIQYMRQNVYCDTNTLRSNAHHADNKTQRELAALVRLADDPRVRLCRSNIVEHEVADVRKEKKRNRLAAEHDALERVTLTEKLLRIDSLSDRMTCLNWPVFSDVQNEAMCEKLVKRGLDLRDAQHIVQAVSNDCGVFLTRDEETIIAPHRAWIEESFPIKVRLPSELVAELEAAHS